MNQLGLVGIVAMLVTSLGCATAIVSDGDKAPYYDAAFNDHNRAPAAISTPAPISNGQTIDPLFLRTQADYNFAMGESYSLEGQHMKAIESFKLTLIYDTNSETVRLRLASEYVKMGFLTEALSQVEEVVKANPKSIEGHLLLAGIHSSMRLFPKAISEYEAVLKIKPEHLDARLYMGAIYSELKQFDKALRSFEYLTKSQEYSTPHMAYYYMARVRMDMGGEKNLKLAELDLEKSLSIKPTFHDAAIALGSIYARRGDEKHSYKFYAEHQRKYGPSQKLAELLARHYIEMKEYDLAFEQLEILEGDTEDPLSVKMKMALILIDKKIYPKAIEKLEDIMRIAPDSDKVRFYLSAVYEESGDKDRALVNYKKIPPASQYFPDSVIHAANILRMNKNLDEALLVTEKALQARTDSPTIYMMHASMLDEKNLYKDALAVLNQGIEKFPDNVQMHFVKGTILDHSGERTKVIAVMKKVVELDPTHVQGLNYLAFLLAEAKTNLAEAERFARKAVQLEPKDGYILDTLGWVLFQQGKYVESVKFLEAASLYQPEVSIIAEHLGDVYYKQSLVEKAKSMYNKAVELETDTAKIDELKRKLTSIGDQNKNLDRYPASSANSTPKMAP